jgi:YYY domain-containing protein
MMTEILKWWLLFIFVGIVTFPLTFTVFKHAHTRGYGISKVFGLLICGYMYWLGNSVGFISNTRRASLLTFVAILVYSLFVFKKNRTGITKWFKQNQKLIVFSESLFLISALFMLILRLASPEIIGTEKPMELAFLNGISQSTHFPPQDPWLSGYSISYYYFGYVIINLAVKLLASPTGVAFNLGLIFWFALIAQASSDCLINILTPHEKPDTKEPGTKNSFLIYLASILAPIFILILSNSEGLLELLHSLGVFWKEDVSGVWQSRFWSWIDIKELTDPPVLPLNWNIFRPGATWWWRASRVLQDYTLTGQPREIINEFPFFSFFLGDLHPHLLAMPFVLLSIAVVVEVYRQETVFSGVDIISFFAYFRAIENWIIAFTIGSLIFLNTWDFPIYFALIALVILYKAWCTDRHFKQTIKMVSPKIIALGLMAIVLYSPFLISFSSQAGGILPSLIFQTRSIHQFVMFLPLLMPILLHLFFQIIPNISWKNWVGTFTVCVGIYIFGILMSFGLAALMGSAPMLQQSIRGLFDNTVINETFQLNQQAAQFLSVYQAQSVTELISTTIRMVITDPWIKLLFLVCISTPTAYMLQLSKVKVHTDTDSNPRDVIWGLLLIIASVLVLFPEVFYLRDQFGWRMNTIFKFYYQGWILLSICAAYAFIKLVSVKRIWKKSLLTVLSLLAILSGLIYPFYAIKERVAGLQFGLLDLDGTRYYSRSNPEEMSAIEFIKEQGCGIVAEAVGGSYSNYARVSKLSGCQTVLGWPGHELQWRGSSDPLGTREVDIRELYSTNDWLTASRIIDQYQIKYIFIGDLERATYQVEEAKFSDNLSVVFSNDNVVIYARIDNGS